MITLTTRNLTAIRDEAIRLSNIDNFPNKDKYLGLSNAVQELIDVQVSDTESIGIKGLQIQEGSPVLE